MFAGYVCGQPQRQSKYLNFRHLSPVPAAIIWALTWLSVPSIFGQDAITYSAPFVVCAVGDLLFFVYGLIWGSRHCDAQRWLARTDKTNYTPPDYNEEDRVDK